MFHPAIEIFRNDHKTSSHFVILSRHDLFDQSVCRNVVYITDEYVFGPGQNSCSTPSDMSNSCLENVATVGINTIVPMEV